VGPDGVGDAGLLVAVGFAGVLVGVAPVAVTSLVGGGSGVSVGTIEVGVGSRASERVGVVVARAVPSTLLITKYPPTIVVMTTTTTRAMIPTITEVG